ncbi:radical SAM protein [Candidatus Falkowbacteria bacterium]|nr:radical SAM protein [Candidatus Falkowbacteria bacterium]
MSKKHTIKSPIDAVVAVTYRCNSRCIMCNIWQIKDFPEMPAEAYAKLPRSLRDINISGGEPFLRDDLVEIVRVMQKACPKANINISTNGFLVDTIKSVLPKIKEIYPRIAVSVSIDGIGQMHEQVRRVPGAWQKALETIRFCRDHLKIKNIKLAFTLNNLNYHQLRLVYDWSKRLGVQFTMAVAHSSKIYFGKDNALTAPPRLLEKEFTHVINDLLNSLKPKDWVRAYFIDGLLKISTGQKRPLESYAGEDFFYLDPKGDVYPSVIDNVIMANIGNFKKFVDLWHSKQAHKARNDVKGFESNYWMVCTARAGIKRNPLKVANWIFKNKLLLNQL